MSGPLLDLPGNIRVAIVEHQFLKTGEDIIAVVDNAPDDNAIAIQGTAPTVVAGFCIDDETVLRALAGQDWVLSGSSRKSEVPVP